MVSDIKKRCERMLSLGLVLLLLLPMAVPISVMAEESQFVEGGQSIEAEPAQPGEAVPVGEPAPPDEAESLAEDELGDEAATPAEEEQAEDAEAPAEEEQGAEAPAGEEQEEAADQPTEDELAQEGETLPEAETEESAEPEQVMELALMMQPLVEPLSWCDCQQCRIHAQHIDCRAPAEAEKTRFGARVYEWGISFGGYVPVFTTAELAWYLHGTGEKPENCADTLEEEISKRIGGCVYDARLCEELEFSLQPIYPQSELKAEEGDYTFQLAISYTTMDPPTGLMEERTPAPLTVPLVVELSLEIQPPEEPTPPVEEPTAKPGGGRDRPSNRPSSIVEPEPTPEPVPEPEPTPEPVPEPEPTPEPAPEPVPEPEPTPEPAPAVVPPSTLAAAKPNVVPSNVNAVPQSSEPLIFEEEDVAIEEPEPTQPEPDAPTMDVPGLIPGIEVAPNPGPKVTPLAAATFSVSALAFGGFALVLAPDLAVLRWYKVKKRGRLWK